MGTSAPKLMLKVELLNRTDVKFTLLQLSTMYTNNIKGSKFLFTDNGWTIYHGKNFSVSKKMVLSLPESCLRQESKITFKDNDERYEYMKGMARALEYWSGSHLFNKINETNNVKLNFHKTIWVIF